MLRRIAARAAVGFVLASALLPLVHAQSWRPDKPVEIVAASGPGGSTDKLARTIQRILQDEKLVPTPVSVVNKAGGNQTLAVVGIDHRVATAFKNLTNLLHQVYREHNYLADSTQLTAAEKARIVMNRVSNGDA